MPPLRARVPAARVSTNLKIQLAWLRSGRACAFGGKDYSFDQRSVVDELLYLKFRRNPNKGETSRAPKRNVGGLLAQAFL